SLSRKFAVTVNEISSPFTCPSEIGVSPCLPETVPVSLFPSALKLKVVSRVCPSRAGSWATHLPFTPPLAPHASIAPARREQKDSNTNLCPTESVRVIHFPRADLFLRLNYASIRSPRVDDNGYITARRL